MSSHTILQFAGIFHRPLFIGLVHLTFSACRWIDFLQLRYGKRRFFRVFSRIVFIKIGKIRLSYLQLRNDLAHLQSPVSQMNVTGHIMPRITKDSLDALPDYGGTKMSHVQRLRHIGSAIVDDDGLLLLRLRHTEFFRRRHLVQITA